MHDFLVKTWEDLKLSYASITQDDFKKTPPSYPPYQDTKYQYCLADNKMTKDWKVDDI